MDYNYAREKLNLLLRDLDSYTDDEFWRQMSRIAAGATGEDHAEEIAKERDALAAYAEAGKHIVHEWGRGEFGDVAAAVQLDQWARTQPALCLARLKAEWQAEALEEYREDFGSAGVGFVDCLIKQLRRQAEEK